MLIRRKSSDYFSTIRINLSKLVPRFCFDLYNSTIEALETMHVLQIYLFTRIVIWHIYLWLETCLTRLFHAIQSNPIPPKVLLEFCVGKQMQKMGKEKSIFRPAWESGPVFFFFLRDVDHCWQLKTQLKNSI